MSSPAPPHQQPPPAAATPPAWQGRSPVASVVMATRNRKDELRTAITSCLRQSVPVEIIIRDDGSTDGTEEMVRAEFPTVDYARSPQPRGSIANRNDAVRAARTGFIFSIDDDAAFDSPRTVEQTMKEFDHPRVGAVAIPYIDVLKSPKVEQVAPDADHVWVLNFFRGCAAAWRREVFLGVGGYAPVLYHMAEEPELGMKMLGAGYVTRLGRADPIHHFESPKRDHTKVLRLVAKNGLLMAVLNTPTLLLPVHLAGTMVKSCLYAVRTGVKGTMLRGVIDGWKDAPRAWSSRRPVPMSAYRLYRFLSRHGARRLDEVEVRLPPRKDFAAGHVHPLPAR